MGDVKSNQTGLVTTDKLGTVSYADGVIAIIAGLATVDIPGVAGMSGGISNDIAEMLGRKNLTKGVKVEVGNEEAAVDLMVIIEYGYKIGEVAKNIQEAVKSAIETMTGLRVVEVNVRVQGVNIEKPAPTPEMPRVR